MRSICVVVTARPSYSRIKTALEAIKGHSGLKLRLVVAASACSMVEQIRNDGFEIAAVVPTLRGKYTRIAMAKTAGTGVHELATLFETMGPDIVLTIADRYETLATAVAASYLHIPLAHTQGGECTGSIDNKVRNAVTQLADIHFPATKRAFETISGISWQVNGTGIVFMGESYHTPNKHVYLTGCPSIDLAARMKRDPRLRPHDYLVVILHPVTDEGEACAGVAMESIVRAVEQLKVKAFVVGPNQDAGALSIIRTSNANVSILTPCQPKSPEDFLELVANSACVVGNSSMGIRECSYLGVPAVNIGRRQEGRERGPNVLDVGTDVPSIGTAVKFQLKHGHYKQSKLYGDGGAGKKIAECLASVSLS